MAQYVEEGLEVVSDSLPEVYYSSLGKEVTDPTSVPEVYYSSLGKEVADPIDDGNGQGKLLGPRPRWFWLFLVAFFVILAAAVGGGVGGTRASKDDPK